MLRKNAKCYGCVWFNECKNNEHLREKCENENYVLFTTKADKDLCDIMCGGIENEID